MFKSILCISFLLLLSTQISGMHREGSGGLNSHWA